MNLRYGVIALVLSCIGLALGALACQDDSRNSGANNANNGDNGEPNAVLVSLSSFQQAAALGRDDRNLKGAAVSMAEKADLGSIRMTTTGVRDLRTALVGEETQITFDIDADGTGDSVYVFVAALDNMAFASWRQEATCHLAWQDGQTLWYIEAVCGGAEGVVCAIGETSTCLLCDDIDCGACSVDGSEVYCQDDTNNGTNNGTNNPTNNGTNNPTNNPTNNSTPGTCDSVCMNQSMAECCTTCGCSSDVVCRPSCGSGFEWDCEMLCCFSYETYECQCGSGALWDVELGCCQIDGVCL